MSIPKLYTVLPKNGENLDTTVLTDHSSDIITRNDGEQLVVLSYFPKTLKYSKKSDFLLNKYILFVINENKSADYSVSWKYDLLEG
ncbi:MAG: hypothetical protein AB8B56_16670, partial [Crocinitomicaceae bacterium]